MFTLVWENSIAQLYVLSQPVVDSDPAVLVCFGNTCDFHSGMVSWRDSPGWAANAVLCVKDRTMDQATYRLVHQTIQIQITGIGRTLTPSILR